MQYGDIIEYIDCTYDENFNLADRWCRENNATLEELIDRREYRDVEEEYLDGEEIKTRIVSKMFRYFLIMEKPAPSPEEKQAQVRAVREQYFADYVDWYQSKPLLWEEMTNEEKQDIADYRNYLKNYTKEENWWEKNPLDFNSWKGQNNEKTSSE